MESLIGLYRRIRIPFRMLIVSLLLGLAAMAAYAAEASSSWKMYGPINGHTYLNRATVSDTPAMRAITENSTTSTSVPTGYMGVVARLWKDGVLCSAGNWYYNSQPVKTVSSVKDDYCGSGDYTSFGQTRAYDGNAYVTEYTYQSPIIQH